MILNRLWSARAALLRRLAAVKDHGIVLAMTSAV